MKKTMALMMVFGLVLAISGAAQAFDYTATQAGNWSSSATWGGAGVPGAGDRAYCGSHAITYDAGASGSVDFVEMTGSLTLQRDLAIQYDFATNGNTTLTLGGNTLTAYQMRTAWGYNSGMFDFVRGSGGALDVDILCTDGGGGATWKGYTLTPDDQIGDVRVGCQSEIFFQPDVTVTHLHTNPRPSYSDPGISGYFTDGRGPGRASLTQNLGDTTGVTITTTLTTGEVPLTLNFDATLGLGPIDWGLRWTGDHVASLQGSYAGGKLIVNASEPFDPNVNIFYNAGDNYTYVGFETAPIPEPAGLGLIGMALLAMRRRRS